MLGQSVNYSGVVNNSYPQSNIGQTPQFGVASALSELIEEANRSALMSDELRSCLGIAIPKDSQTQTALNDSLVNALRVAAGIIRNSNQDLTDCIQHLRS